MALEACARLGLPLIHHESLVEWVFVIIIILVGLARHVAQIIQGFLLYLWFVLVQCPAQHSFGLIAGLVNIYSWVLYLVKIWCALRIWQVGLELLGGPVVRLVRANVIVLEAVYTLVYRNRNMPLKVLLFWKSRQVFVHVNSPLPSLNLRPLLRVQASILHARIDVDSRGTIQVRDPIIGELVRLFAI